jgi:hypothetical protein
MIILSHRGYWNESITSNSLQAFSASLEARFGFESDIRDYNGEMVISHNIADESCPKAELVFKMLHEYQDRYCFAINIKADGLKDMLADFLMQNQIQNYFTFDMSVPQMIEYREKGITYFARQSEVELAPVMYEHAAGVWIDAFFEDSWITEKLLGDHLSAGKKVCLVSPDLHKREQMPFWTRLRDLDLDFSQVMLCTDMPNQAQKFFNLDD